MRYLTILPLAFLLAAASPAPTPFKAQNDDAWAAALSHVQRATYHYRGRVTGTEGPGEIVVGLDAARGGKLSGYAVLIRHDGTIEGSGPVSGTAEASRCSMEVVMQTIALTLTGSCRPDALSGTMQARSPGFDFVRWVYSQGHQDDLGAYWLTATQ